MIIKVDNKFIDNLNRIYLNEYSIPLFINLVSDSGIIILLTCESGNLSSFTASIVVRAESFESVCQDNCIYGHG